jgi:pimeloyl-ACP methyl ester carboxylesterase
LATLAHTDLTADGARPERWVAFLHGLLGRGANWRSFARRWVDTHPTWGAMLVDLRLHGDSPGGFPPPHTVGAAASDLLSLLADASPGPVTALVGHSLGGKVVLAAQRQSDHRFSRAVVLDASPAARPDGLGSEQSRDILELLGRMPARFGNRTEFITQVEAAGQPRAIAQWLAMNLVVDQPGLFRLGVELPGMASLFRSVLAEDDWDVVTSVRPPERLSFVSAAPGVVDPQTLSASPLLRLLRGRAGGPSGRWPLAPGRSRRTRVLRRGGAGAPLGPPRREGRARGAVLRRPRGFSAAAGALPKNRMAERSPRANPAEVRRQARRQVCRHHPDPHAPVQSAIT